MIIKKRFAVYRYEGRETPVDSLRSHNEFWGPDKKHRAVHYERLFRRVSKEGKILYCPDKNCNKEMKYRYGQKRGPHFAHKGKFTCSGQTIQHLFGIESLFDIIKQKDGRIDESRSNKEIRANDDEGYTQPDITILLQSNHRIHIEVQHSPINTDYILSKIKRNTENNAHSIYIFDAETHLPKFNSGIIEHKLKDFEKYIHKMNFGKLYYYIFDKDAYNEGLKNCVKVFSVGFPRLRSPGSYMSSNSKEEGIIKEIKNFQLCPYSHVLNEEWVDPKYWGKYLTTEFGYEEDEKDILQAESLGEIAK